MLHFIAERTFLMVGLQYYVNCVRSICVRAYACARGILYKYYIHIYMYTYKTFSRQNILYYYCFRAQEPLGYIRGDERSNSGATNIQDFHPMCVAYIYIFIYYNLYNTFYMRARSLYYVCATCIMFENSHSYTIDFLSFFFSTFFQRRTLYKTNRFPNIIDFAGYFSKTILS